MPTFASYRAHLPRRRSQRSISKYLIPVPLIDLKSLNGFAAGDAGPSNRRHHPGSLLLEHRAQRTPRTAQIVDAPAGLCLQQVDHDGFVFALVLEFDRTDSL